MSYKDRPCVKLHVISTPEVEPDKDDRERGCGWYPGFDSALTRENIVTRLDRHKQFIFSAEGINYVEARPGDIVRVMVEFRDGPSYYSEQRVDEHEDLRKAIDIGVMAVLSLLDEDGRA